jgi:hypothetical protein
MVVELRSKKNIQIEICECEERFLFFQKYNRLSDARQEQIHIADLKLELNELESHESAYRMGFCYE